MLDVGKVFIFDNVLQELVNHLVSFTSTLLTGKLKDGLLGALERWESLEQLVSDRRLLILWLVMNCFLFESLREHSGDPVFNIFYTERLSIKQVSVSLKERQTTLEFLDALLKSVTLSEQGINFSLF